jgi:hypothetical protein
MSWGRPPLQCHRCGQWGHTAKECRLWAAEVKKAQGGKGDEGKAKRARESCREEDEQPSKRRPRRDGGSEGDRHFHITLQLM